MTKIIYHSASWVVNSSEQSAIYGANCAQQVVYRTDDSSTLYIMAGNEGQQNEWIKAVRTGKCLLLHFDSVLGIQCQILSVKYT